MVSPSILFVDDEIAVLNGLRRGMRTVAPDWTLYFANSAIEALDVLSKNPIDVVVSDLRMPALTGDVLHREVLLRHPTVIRIILSGMVDAVSLAKANQWSERYLTKPCGPDQLHLEITEAMRLRDVDRTRVPTVGELPRGATALYIDDDAEAAGQLARALVATDAGVVLSHVADGAMALDHLHARGEFAHVVGADVVLLDLSTPTALRFELLDALLERCRSADHRLIPIIIYTADGDHVTRGTAIDRGAAMALTRPSTWDQYIEAARLISRFAKLVARTPARERLKVNPPAGVA